MSYNDNVRFFYENAGASWNPETETPEEGRHRCAERLAQVEAWGARSGYCFAIQVDPDAGMVSDTDYDQFEVRMYSTDGELVGAIGAIDIGPDADPDWSDHVRVVKAELLSEVAPDDTEHIEIAADELAMIELLNDALRLSNRVDGWHAYQFGGTYGAVRTALLTALTISLGGGLYPLGTEERLSEIAKALANEAVDNGENIAYQIDLWNEGRIS